MHQLPSGPTQNSIVSKILQVALGLFVTTNDLPMLSHYHENVSYDCSFEKECRWSTIGNNTDKWRVARGEPDSLLWLAATGTMQIPRTKQSRGKQADVLMTDTIRCQQGFAELSFTYWIIGNADIEICLADEKGIKFNCTGELNSSVMPGKVSLKIPELQKGFKIMIQPNLNPGVVILDDIRYDATICKTDTFTTHSPYVEENTHFPATSSGSEFNIWKSLKTANKTVKINNSVSSTRPPTTPIGTFPQMNFTTATESPFDLLVIGNRTKPMKDRRKRKLVLNSSELLCDFDVEFACRWGPESGRWAVVYSGAIPSLEDTIGNASLHPTYPAALVLQGVAMLTSDPIPCQTGSSKLLFRYWSNGGVSLQVCAIGQGRENGTTHCFERSNMDNTILAVFELAINFDDPFTLNIVPQWQDNLKNKFLLIDEIAYIGSCKPTTDGGTISGSPLTITEEITKQIPEFSTEKTLIDRKTGARKTTQNGNSIETSSVPTTEDSGHSFEKIPRKRTWLTTFAPVWTTEFTKPTRPQKFSSKHVTSTHEPKTDDYCDILNCNFEDTACNYLNHGLTKKPWTLRNRGYGYPLTGASDIRATEINNQFVSVILDAGDIAILESPKFNATKNLNVLLFQYFRPSQMTTIRFCLGSQYSNPMRTISSFSKCPSILRSVTSKNAYRWNTVHLQIPPGTTHFCLVAHNSEKSTSRSAIAIDNMRVAICDTRGFAPDYIDETSDFQNFPNTSV